MTNRKAVEVQEHILERQVKAVNQTLHRLHKLGQSVESRGNSYPLQLQEGELLQIQVRVNHCKHSWVAMRLRVDPSVKWDLCPDCGMTRNLEDILSAEVVSD